MRVGIDSHSLLLAGGVTLLTRCRCYLARVHVGVAIDGHSLLLAAEHLQGLAAVGDARGAELEALCKGWAQPANFR